MRSLFLKIFLAFWVTVIATGTALLLTFILEPRSVPSRWHTTLSDTARYTGTVAVETAERNGIGSASAYLDRIAQQTHLASCLFDSAGKVLAGTRCDDFRDMVSRVTVSRDSDFSMKYGIARAASMISGPSGSRYIFATELPAGPRAAVGMNRNAILLQWGVALLVSGLICSLLTRYLTTPILRLQEMSQRLTSGDLSVRAGPELSERRDEFGELVRGFNTMASRIEELISRQRQLTSDVSHELRSPLARLNVALDLGRQRKGDDPAFDQMEADITLLDEMVGRLLTIAKLDIGAPQEPMAEVDLTDLLSQIVRDAEFESRQSNRAISFTSTGQCLVWGSAELLRSAIENVIRNAIRYTDAGTTVEVRLQCETLSGKPSIRLSVRDFGPGVPASELSNIFQPFYRVATARDRQSGGTGLGLAIADRVVRMHGGTIHAELATPRGLRIEILLPQSSGPNATAS
ncbi:ATP-binding protein [Occallatibacter riparius]|uniref:histidine kinase n=1 Tax=Occallatibacter riparius TaxID=1002689 RepID=A0A9J7BLU2_9BACT|nr:ATP-binding protein [Occallatibacter riparius]UWZ83627.1 ATP-binding protein [Occallatibacter riparius]